MFSFLYVSPKNLGNVHNSLQDLHIDEIIQSIMPNKEDRYYVETILSEFDRNSENIYYRQQILNDFIDNDKLFASLNNIAKDATDVNVKYHKLGQDPIQLNIFFSHFTMDKYNLSGIRMQQIANCTLDALLLYEKADKILQKYNIASQGLKTFKEKIHSVIVNEGYNKLKKLMNDTTKISGSYDLQVFLNNRMAVDDASIVMNYDIPSNEVSKGFFKRKNSWETNKLLVNEKTIFEMDYFVGLSVTKIIKAMSDIFDDLFSPFTNTNKEMLFYKFGLEYYNKMKNLGLNLCFPTFDTDYNIRELADSYLAISGYKEYSKPILVCVNDFKISQICGGVLVVGPNNTGKTVYTRSIGIAQVFAQSGLMVCAKSANVILKKQIITCYASKESSEFDGGRFETEVRALKFIIDESDNETLVIINEIFQSTAVDEGTEALYDVLNYMAKKDIKWVCVSHFLALSGMARNFTKTSGKKIELLNSKITNDKYVIEREL